MKIGIISAVDTKKETIEELVKDVPLAFPRNFGIELYDTKKRYETRPREIVSLEEISYLSSQTCEFARDLDGTLYRNILRLEDEARFLTKGHVALIVVHQPYIHPNDRFIDSLSTKSSLVSKSPRGYSGFTKIKKGLIVLGAINRADKNNAKIVSHEVAHIILDDFDLIGWKSDAQLEAKKLKDTITYGEVNHCKGQVTSGMDCLMNTTGPIDDTLSNNYHGFCASCMGKLLEVKARLKRI